MRHIQAPDVEINEIDRSQYGTGDYSLPNAPACLMAGFADKGQDYVINWVNSNAKYEELYGVPTNEAEKYLYNSANEVLTRGGICLVAKLPYWNLAKDKYTYTSYTLDKTTKKFTTVKDIIDDKINSKLINKTLYKFLFFPDIDLNTIRYFITEHKLSVQIGETNSDTGEFKKIGAFVEEDFPSDALDYFNQPTQYLDIDNGSDNYTNTSITELLTRNGIYLQTIADLLQYVDDKCDFSYSAYRAFKHLFYDESGNCKNNAMYLLSAIYTDPSPENLSVYVPDYSKYMDEIMSMHNTLVNVEGLDDFESYYVSFVRDKSIDYFKKVYDEVVNIIETSDIIHSETDRDVLKQIIHSFKDLSAFSIDYTDIPRLDHSISTYYEIRNNDLSDSIHLSFDKFDDFKTGVSKPEENQFYIVDMTRSKYSKMNILSGDQLAAKQKVCKDKEFLGIVPVVTSPVNALYFQDLLRNDDADIRISAYNPVCDLQGVYVDNEKQDIVGRDIKIEDFNYSIKLSSVSDNEGTVSEIASKQFPAIQIQTDGYLSRDYIKHIGVVVFKAFKDTANNDKIGFQLLESFVGSLDRDAQDPITHNNLYIGNMINDRSNFINFFSNVKINDMSSDFDTYLINNQTATSLGFYEFECEKDISYQESINKPLNIILEHANNSYQLPLDIVVDAGVSNIAQFIRTIYWSKGYGKYDFNKPDNLTTLKNVTAKNVQAWQNILRKYDNFCKNIRKDCVFIADGLRNFALIGNEKRVRRTSIKTTVLNDVIPNLKYMVALDSSYSTGYCNWFWVQDNYTGDMMWLPPSIKACGVYIYTDVYYKPWDAPAGMNRGVLNNVYDVAFNPNQFEAGKIYNQQWNYAISYPVDGIVQEGQKTFQKNKTALDRVNVRRLMLYLEKKVVRIGRYYLYEGNTEYLRSNFVDAITAIFDDAVDGGGIKEYAIKCDEDNNTPETIDRNELHAKIAVKPIKTLEFLVADFVITNQSANVNEEVLR